MVMMMTTMMMLKLMLMMSGIALKNVDSVRFQFLFNGLPPGLSAPKPRLNFWC